VTDYNVKALTKPLYNSFFENCESLNDREIREMVQSEESGIDEDINEKVVNHLSELQSKARNTKSCSKLTNNEIEKAIKPLQDQLAKNTQDFADQKVVNTRLLGYIQKNKYNIKKVENKVDDLDKFIKSDKRGGFNHKMALINMAIKNGTYTEPAEEDEFTYSLDSSFTARGLTEQKATKTNSDVLNDYYNDCSLTGSYNAMFS